MTDDFSKTLFPVAHTNGPLSATVAHGHHLVETGWAVALWEVADLCDDRGQWYFLKASTVRTSLAPTAKASPLRTQASVRLRRVLVSSDPSSIELIKAQEMLWELVQRPK